VELQKRRIGSRTEGVARMKSHMGGAEASRRVSTSWRANSGGDVSVCRTGAMDDGRNRYWRSQKKKSRKEKQSMQ
jgi:hypothetical protein